MNRLTLFLTINIVLALGVTLNLLAGEDKTESPYFFISSDNPKIDRLPLISTNAEVNIAGVMADVIITQQYKNDGLNPIEAVYTFPASTKAAVYGMTMKIGDRLIEAKIQEKEKARQNYEQAKEQGKRTSLLEQNRPNVFTMNVANIMPGDLVEVILKYTELLVPTDKVYEFVYPTVVGPRYSSPSNETASLNNEFVSTPYLKSGIEPSYNFDLHLRLSAGMPIQNVNCKTHKVDVQYPSLQIANVDLSPNESKGGNRDFVLNYQLAGGKIESGLLLYEGKDENFFTLMIQPPKRVTVDHIPPREYIFVVDVSGSMRGFPLNVSKNLLRNLISGLRPTDRFNVILFAGTSYLMSEESLHANENNIQIAINTIDSQRGGGGTEILPALNKALDLPRCSFGLSRSIVIVTDGYISVEKECFDLISTHLDESNVFTFGIGSGVNRYLLEGMAHVGLGEPFVVENSETAVEQAEKFREYIQSPVLTQIQAHYGDFEVYDVEPKSIPDVLAERPVVIYGKWKGKPKGTIKIKGYTGGSPYYASFNVEEVLPDPANEALKYVWAREKIMMLDDYKIVERTDRIKKEVTNLGLKYNLMTAYTSFVAIDHERVNKEGLETVKQPLPLPANVSNSAVGFDMEIEGVVRKSKKAVTYKVDIEEIECNLEESELLILKNTISQLLNNEIQKSGLTINQNLTFDLELTLSTNGDVSQIKIIGETDEALKNYLEFLFIGWHIEGLNPTHELKLIIPINILQ